MAHIRRAAMTSPRGHIKEAQPREVLRLTSTRARRALSRIPENAPPARPYRSRLSGSRMGAKAEDTYRKAPCQGEGPSQETSGEAAGGTNRLGEEALHSEGRGEKRAAPPCDQLLC